MGIKDLWNFLTPYMERKPLFELSNKVVAIDLSGWVCESLNVVDYFVHPRFYLRNLFFRTCYLLQSGITPVFVLEGTAPPLKYGVIVKRNQVQFRGARPKKVTNCDRLISTETAAKEKPTKSKEQKRNCLHQVLKQCEELLNAMGLVCVQAPGEAEALCAYLNHDNLIYGVISQDSDCFAYGAVRVFRNFCASQNGGSVEIYDLQRLNNSSLRFGREKIVTMALLSGCDYCPAGVVGVGREMVTRFLNCYDNHEILPKVRSWRKTADRLTELEIKAGDPNICSECGHVGKLAKHRKSGCMDCHISLGCDSSQWKQQRANIKAELDIKRKALTDPEFPQEPIIEEFLTRPCQLPTLDLSWRQPNLVKFIKSMSASMQWAELYCFQKMLPLFTRWQMHATAQSSIFLHPDYIKKKRRPKGIASYEIVWKDTRNMFQGLIPQDQIDAYLNEVGNSLECLWSTIEPQDVVQQSYPDLVETFLQNTTKGRKKKALAQSNASAKPKKKKDSSAVSKENTKKRATKKTDTKDPTLDAFLKNSAKLQAMGKTSSVDVENQPDKLIGSPSNETELVDHFLNFTAELENIAEDGTANDLFNSSEVIDRICAPNYLESTLKEYMAIIESEKKTAALHHLLSQSFSTITETEMEDSAEDGGGVQHRLVLKQDILNASLHCTSLNNSQLNQSCLRPRNAKRKSFFFEPIDIPPPDEEGHETIGMDMFECSLMLKDQIVVAPNFDDEGTDANQTIIYDIDF